MYHEHKVSNCSLYHYCIQSTWSKPTQNNRILDKDKQTRLTSMVSITYLCQWQNGSYDSQKKTDPKHSWSCLTQLINGKQYRDIEISIVVMKSLEHVWFLIDMDTLQLWDIYIFLLHWANHNRRYVNINYLLITIFHHIFWQHCMSNIAHQGKFMSFENSL